MNETNKNVAYLLLDDDPFIRKAWARSAKFKGIELITIEKTEEFWPCEKQISKENTLIYLDSELGVNQPKGEEFAEVLKEKGYKNLFLATGHAPEDYTHLPWLKVVKKDCPW